MINVSTAVFMLPKNTRDDAHLLFEGTSQSPDLCLQLCLTLAGGVSSALHLCQLLPETLQGSTGPCVALLQSLDLSLGGEMCRTENNIHSPNE